MHQPYSMATDFKGVVSTIAVAFWLSGEYVIPVSKNVKMPRNVPLNDDRTCTDMSGAVCRFLVSCTPWAELGKFRLHHTCFMVEIFLAMREKCG